MQRMEGLRGTSLAAFAALASACFVDSGGLTTSDAGTTDPSSAADDSSHTKSTDPWTTDDTSAGPTTTDETTTTTTSDSDTDPSTTGAPELCGDGVVQREYGEECDDGLENADDALCTSRCQVATCGDGLVLAGVEECDDGGESARCDVDCSPAYCGDGQLNQSAGESCELNVFGVACSACVPARYVFVTSLTSKGDLGGLAGADARCQSMAEGAGLTGTYLAWLSTKYTDPAERFTQDDRPFILVDGTVVASGWDELTSGALQHAITLTETGATPELIQAVWGSCDYPGPTNYRAAVFSAVAYNGESLNDLNCSEWTKSIGEAIFGVWLDAAMQWTTWCSMPEGCNIPSRHYCFQQ